MAIGQRYTSQNLFRDDLDFRYIGLDDGFKPWMLEAKRRIFSVAAGNRIAKLAPLIMNVGFAKVLYGANELGVDTDTSKAFVFFAPDGSCSYNKVRTQRGFSYGGVLHADFDGLLATCNSMPNGCGYSLYELIDPPTDEKLAEYVRLAQTRLGEEQIAQLGLGNHFAAVYKINDPLSGEDTSRRFVVVHCSGHVGVEKLYQPQVWLTETSGFHEVPTPYGSVFFLEGDARTAYLRQYKSTDSANTHNRDITMEQIFANHLEWRVLERITHQGLREKGSLHTIGTQMHRGLVPIAFNPEEGLIAAETRPNLTSATIDSWEHGQRVIDLGLYENVKTLNFTPHGGGYEFRYPVKRFEIQLGPHGIHQFSLETRQVPFQFSHFKSIRQMMTYRRKAPLIQKMGEFGLIDIVYDMPSLMQIYPPQNIPGGNPSQ